MQRNKYAVFMDPAKMERARALGMTNFSGWVNEKIDSFIECGEKVLREAKVQP